ncbi:MAG: LytR family transcriptional regulator [Microbacteriaceae bacterium]|nr:LytR family transcriptional regulator [Microbacteriaceae bacterium]
MAHRSSGRAVAPTPPIRHGRLTRSNPVLALLRILGIVVAVAIVGSVSVAGIAVWQVAASVKPGVHLVHADGSTQAPPPEIGAIDGGVNLLLAGTDTRANQGEQFQNKADLAASSGAGNNDVTMLLHISQDHTNATVVSFPRDLMVSMPACPRAGGGSSGASSNTMFNTALSRGGLSCVVLTVEKMTGLDIPYAAEISFDGVISMSDAVGGVTVCVATPINDPYTGINLGVGQQDLQGATALGFVRSRHGVGDGSDLGRISNQQVFMSALARKITSGGVLQNPIQLYSIARAAAKSMTLSEYLANPTTMVSIALALKDMGLGNMVFLQYPSVSDPSNPNRVVAIPSAASVLNAALVADQPVQLSGKVGRAAVEDPNPVVVPTFTPTPTPTATAKKGAKATPTPTPTPTATVAPGAAVVLPPSITGQTAAQQTCSKGNK